MYIYKNIQQIQTRQPPFLCVRFYSIKAVTRLCVSCAGPGLSHQSSGLFTQGQRDTDGIPSSDQTIQTCDQNLPVVKADVTLLLRGLSAALIWRREMTVDVTLIRQRQGFHKYSVWIGLSFRPVKNFLDHELFFLLWLFAAKLSFIIKFELFEVDIPVVQKI